MIFRESFQDCIAEIMTGKDLDIKRKSMCWKGIIYGEDNIMEIRQRAELTALYEKPQDGIKYDSPELVMMQRIAERDFDGAVSLFREKRQFSDTPTAADGP